MELDHLFICCGAGAPEAERLIEFGLVEGSPNRHPGQGTANRRFFFANAFLELLWVDDPADARSAATRRTGLWPRWAGRQAGASPFGVGLRMLSGGATSMSFSNWPYRPAYLPDPLTIHMAANSNQPEEPLLFAIDFGMRPDRAGSQRQQPLAHAVALQSITKVTITSPVAGELSASLQAVLDACPWLTYHRGAAHHLELAFDGERQRALHDFRPALPLTFCW